MRERRTTTLFLGSGTKACKLWGLKFGFEKVDCGVLGVRERGPRVALLILAHVQRMLQTCISPTVHSNEAGAFELSHFFSFLSGEVSGTSDLIPLRAG